MTNEETLKKIDSEIKAIITEAATYAQESPEPNTNELLTDILVEA